MLSALYQLINVFAKPNEAQGNQAAVILQNEQTYLAGKQSTISLDICQHDGLSTVCFISPINNQNYNVRCFNQDKQIQCCGHGLIAAAKTIFSTGDLIAININENTKAFHQIDNESGDGVMLELPRLLAQQAKVPDWIDKTIVFDSEIVEPDKAALSEKEDGYLLLEFETLLPLDMFQGIKLDLKQICENTKRAIVVLQFDQENKHLYTRYFAPQYGVDEDIATGSVMRFVADYIEKKYQCSHFDVSQCSSLGGFMTIDCKAESVLITANAKRESRQ